MEQFSFITSLGLRPNPSLTPSSHFKTPRRTATKSESDTSFAFKNQPRSRARFRSPHPKTPDSDSESLVFFPGFRSTSSDKKKKKGAGAGAGSTPQTQQNRSRKRSQNGKQTTTPVKLSYKEMIVKSMESLDVEKGSPMHSIQAIKGWMITKYNVVTNQGAFNKFFGKAFLIALEEGRIIRMTGQGLTGSFRLNRNRMAENGKTPTTPAPTRTPTRPMTMPMPAKTKSKTSAETPTNGIRLSATTTPASRKPKTSTVTSATTTGGSGMELRSSRKIRLNSETGTGTGAGAGTSTSSAFTPNTVRSNQRVQRWLDNNMESVDSHSTPQNNNISPATSPADADANNVNFTAGFEFETITLTSSDSDSDSDDEDDDDDPQNDIYEMDLQKLARTRNPNKENNVNQVSRHFGRVGVRVGGQSSNYGEARRQPAVEPPYNQNNQMPLMDFSANYKTAVWDESMYLREWELEHDVENNNPGNQIMGSLNMVGAGSSNYGQGEAEAAGASGSSDFAQPSLFSSLLKGASGATDDQVRMANLAGRINGIAIAPAASTPFKRQVTKQTIDEDEYDL